MAARPGKVQAATTLKSQLTQVRARLLVQVGERCQLKGLTRQATSSACLQLTNCVEAQQFDRAMLEELFPIANEMEKVKRGTAAAKMLDGAYF